MPTTYKITGRDALRLAERDKLDLYCYGSRKLTDNGIVALDIARQIPKQEQHLLFVLVSPTSNWINATTGKPVDGGGRSVSDYFDSGGSYRGCGDSEVEPVWRDADELEAPTVKGQLVRFRTPPAEWRGKLYRLFTDPKDGRVDVFALAVYHTVWPLASTLISP